MGIKNVMQKSKEEQRRIMLQAHFQKMGFFTVAILNDG
jgi:ATP-dependent Clp protease adapter protein ClpS